MAKKVIKKGKVETLIGVSHQTRQLLERRKNPNTRETYEDVLRKILTNLGDVYV